MRSRTTFSQSYSVYYVYGSAFSGSITYHTKEGLAEMRERLIDHWRKDNTIEAIRFDEIWKTVATEMKGAQSVKFVKKVTNHYW